MVKVAFIPARGGSVGIKNKNLQKVGGKTLIKRSFEHAVTSDIFDNIIISTDSFDIASEIFPSISFKDFGHFLEDELILIDSNLFLHKRKTEQAQVLSPIRDVLFNISQKIDYKYLWLLQPTSPFRENIEFLTIDQVVSTLTKSNTEWSSIVSFKSTNGYHPDRMVKKIGDYVVPILGQTNGDNVPRQTLDTIHIKDGGFYVLKKENLDKKIMLGDRIIPFIREGLKTINIDSLDELKKAQESEEVKRGNNR